MIKSCGALLALLGLFGIATCGLFLEYSKPHNYEQPTKTENQNSPRANSSVDLVQNHNSEKGEKEKRWYESFFEKPTDSLLVIFNGLLALYTWKLFRATSGLFIETAGLRTAADQQARDMKASIAAAQISAEAAKKSADAAVAAERARFYVAIKDNFIACINAAATWDGPWEQEERPLAMNIQPMAEISFKNYGKTPGIIVEVGTGIVYAEDIPDPVYDVKVVMENIIGADRSSEGFGTLIYGQITMAQAKKVRSGEGNIWIFGYANYDDVFGERQVHRFFQRLVCVIPNARYVLQSYDHKHYNSST